MDPRETEAIHKMNRIFDKWLRNIMSQKSAAMSRPKLHKLENGQEAAPMVHNINWEIAVNSGTLIKNKPLPMSRLTTRSFYDDAPYR